MNWKGIKSRLLSDSWKPFKNDENGFYSSRKLEPEKMGIWLLRVDKA